MPIDEEHLIYVQAGELLRRWHDHPSPATETDRAAIAAAISQQAAEAEQLPLIAEHITTPQRDLVKAAAELPRLAAATPVVYRHGDYATRNWLWDSHDGRLGVIDFAMADTGLLAEELVWLHGAVWVQRPDMRTAFFDGYGRYLSQDEERAL